MRKAAVTLSFDRSLTWDLVEFECGEIFLRIDQFSNFHSSALVDAQVLRTLVLFVALSQFSNLEI